MAHNVRKYTGKCFEYVKFISCIVSLTSADFYLQYITLASVNHLGLRNSVCVCVRVRVHE